MNQSKPKLRNTRERYGILAMTLHWGTALLFLALYASIYFREWFTQPRTPEHWIVLQLHFSFGMTALVFGVLRIIYRLWDKTPDPIPPPPSASCLAFSKTTLAHMMHGILYLVMIVMPMTGYLGTRASVQWFGLVEIPAFNSTVLYQSLVKESLGLTWEQFEKPLDFIHKEGGECVVWVLIALHVATALWHHFRYRDATLRRMLP